MNSHIVFCWHANILHDITVSILQLIWYFINIVLVQFSDCWQSCLASLFHLQIILLEFVGFIDANFHNILSFLDSSSFSNKGVVRKLSPQRWGGGWFKCGRGMGVERPCGRPHASIFSFIIQVRSKLEYCIQVWNSWRKCKEELDKLFRTRGFEPRERVEKVWIYTIEIGILV